MGSYSNQFIATEALYTVCKIKKKGRILQVSNPVYQIQRGGGKEERGRVHPLGRKAVMPQPNAVQDINSQGFFKGRLK